MIAYFFAGAGRIMAHMLKGTMSERASRSGWLRASLFTSKIMVAASSGLYAFHWGMAEQLGFHRSKPPS